MRLGRKYVGMLRDRGKILQVVKAAKANLITCSICDHSVGSHYVPNQESMSTWELTKLLTGSIPAGTRKYCLGTLCKLCEGHIEVECKI